MDRLQDSVPLSDFQQNAPLHLRRLARSKRPAMLTSKGRAAAIVMTPAEYGRLADAAAFAESVRRVKVSLRQFDEGKGKPASQVLRRLRAKYSTKARRTG